tara:strand:- start:1479 stop:1865 length:387 start_codon:yes stop_codon:yes gene_type:complete
MDIKTQKNMKKYDGLKFDFSDVKDEHKKAVNEACDILKEQGVNQNIIENLKLKFKIKEIPSYDIMKSPFVQYCLKNNVHVQPQGNITTAKNNEPFLYPVVSVTEDIRKLNIVFDKIFEDGIAAAKQIK